MTDEKNPIVKVIERDGCKINIYADGSEYNVTLGQIARGPDAARITTSEQGKEMVARRRELNRQAAEEAADEAAEEAIEAGKISIRGDKDRLGLRALVKKNMQLALGATSGRGIEGPNTFVARAVDYFVPDEKAPVGNTFNIVEVPPEILKALVDLRARLAPPSLPGSIAMDIIEGRLPPEEK